MNHSAGLAKAVEDFRSARSRAALEQVMARLTGKSAELLSYEDVRQKLKVTGQGKEELKEIPLDAIVGSVNRYTDFTRRFLPKQDSDQGRWAGVKQAVAGPTGLPPIEVYQIGDAYFVLDGNHRVSVARQLGASQIEAFVTEIRTKVPLSPDDQPDDLIVKAEYAAFLQHTRLDKLRPQANLSVTVPGQYPALQEHIAVHRYFMGLDQQRDISYPEAVTHWYDYVYLPVVQVIRERSILYEFPQRTETDLYLWIAEHRAELERELGWEIEPAAAASDLAAQASSKPGRVVARVGAKIRDAVLPDELETGPAPGEWRAERQAVRRDDRLFADLLVAVNGGESGWQALAQALEVARREGSRLLGLHIVPTQEQKESPAAQAVQTEFDQRCQAAGVRGKLALAVGKVQRTICQRSRWADLVTLNLAYPPPAGPLAKLGSGFRTIIRRCPRPILAVPGPAQALNRALLAYDGSPKAKEGLFVATYLAGSWEIPLVVVTVAEKGLAASETLDQARTYLAPHGIEASFVRASGSVAEAILEMAKAHQSALIIIGGYGHNPVVEVVLGSTVDRVLRQSRKPLLICR